MARTLPLSMVCVGLAVAAAAWAQDPASPLASFQQNAVKRDAEWTTLTTNLEQRLARLLPCDPRIPGAVEETSRASDARIAALTTYWMAVSGKSKSQIDSIRRLMAQEEARKGEWGVDRSEADQERVAITDQTGFLAIAASRVPAFGGAQKILASTSQTMLRIEAQVKERQGAGEQLNTELRDLLAASQARQTAIEAQLKLISTEGIRWTTYYSARIARAQTECSITNQDSGAAEPSARKGAAKKGASK